MESLNQNESTEQIDNVKKPKGRPVKYHSDEERKQAHKESYLRYYAKKDKSQRKKAPSLREFYQTYHPIITQLQQQGALPIETSS
jgi:hypothetical protein